MWLVLQCSGQVSFLVPTLNLLLTDEEGMIRKLSYHPGLGHSSHPALSFSVACYTERCIPSETAANCYKDNYGLLREVLNEADWARMQDMDVYQAY